MEYEDASGRLVCVGAANISYNQFARIAGNIIKQFNGKIIAKAEDGFSTFYWDLIIEDTTICLHFHDMVSDFVIISLEGSRSDALAKRIASSCS